MRMTPAITALRWRGVGFAIAFTFLINGASLLGRSVVESVFCEEQTYDAFFAATYVSAFRLHLRDPRANELGESHELKDYARSEEVALTAAQIVELRRIVTDESSYAWYSEWKNGVKEAKLCGPNYGVLFVFRGGKETVSVALCFQCDQIGVFRGEGNNPASTNEESDIDPAVSLLVKLVKEVFPHDQELQKLNPQRPSVPPPVQR